MSVNSVTNKQCADKNGSSGINANPMYLVFMAMANAADTQNNNLNPLYAQNSELYERYSELQDELKQLNDQLNTENNKLQGKKLSLEKQMQMQKTINEIQQEIVQKRADVEKVRGKMEVLWQSSIQGTQSAIENMIKMAGIFLGNFNRSNHSSISKS